MWNMTNSEGLLDDWCPGFLLLVSLCLHILKFLKPRKKADTQPKLYCVTHAEFSRNKLLLMREW